MWATLAVALVVAGCAAPAATPPRQTVVVTSTTQAFALDGGDYDFHVSPPAAAACVYLLSLNEAAPNLEIPDHEGNTVVIDDGAGSGYHIGPDPEEGGCASTWTVTLTPR